MEGLELIIAKCKRNDREGQFALYKYCYQILMPVCRRYKHNQDDAEWLLNQGFMKILNALDSLDKMEIFDYWAKRIMINCLTDDYRKNKRRIRPVNNGEWHAVGNNDSAHVENEAIQMMTVEELLALLGTLPEPHRTIFNLFAMDGCSHKEIAAKMDISEGTSKWYVHKARNIMKKKINHLYNPIKVNHE